MSHLMRSATIIALLAIQLSAFSPHNAFAQSSMFEFDSTYPSEMPWKQLDLRLQTLYRHGPDTADPWLYKMASSDALYFTVKEITGGLEPDAEDKAASPGPQQFTRKLLQAVASAPVFDWRNKHIVTPVRAQGRCGSCWAFATLGAYEGSWLKVNKVNPTSADAKALNLSEQNLLNCTPHSNGRAGYPAKAMNRVKSNGVDTEQDEPYRRANQHGRRGHFAYTAAAWGFVDKTVFKPKTTQIKAALMQHGPLVVCMCASDNFQAYRNGVFTERPPTTEPRINHVVTLIGWDDTCNAWIIKNSWGTNWGDACGIGTERGYAYIRYDSANIGAYAAWIDAAKNTKLASAIRKVPAAASKEVILVYEPSNKASKKVSIRIKVGQCLQVSLLNWFGVAYTYALSPFNTKILEQMGKPLQKPTRETITGTAGEEEPVVGGDTLVTYTFRGKTKGSAILEFRFGGPNGPDPPDKRIQYVLEVY